jgi:hypothetical protein
VAGGNLILYFKFRVSAEAKSNLIELNQIEQKEKSIPSAFMILLARDPHAALQPKLTN